MINEAEKIIKYQIQTDQTETAVCSEVGITSRTLYNIRRGNAPSNRTLLKLEKFIEKKGL